VIVAFLMVLAVWWSSGKEADFDPFAQYRGDAAEHGTGNGYSSRGGAESRRRKGQDI